MSSKLQEFKDEIIKDILALFKPVSNVQESVIDFNNVLIGVEDPAIDTDYGSNKVLIEKLVLDNTDKVISAIGGHYDDGYRLQDAEPIELEDLTIEEIEALKSAAERAIK